MMVCFFFVELQCMFLGCGDGDIDTFALLGTLSSLKNVKKDVTEMRKGTDCGMGFNDWTAFQIGDQVQCYEEITERRTL